MSKYDEKKHRLGVLKTTMMVTEPNGTPRVKGLILKRDLTTKEALYVIQHLLALDTLNREGFSPEELRAYNQDMTRATNEWLRGEIDDFKYTFTCCDYNQDSIEVMRLIPVLVHLKKKGIID